MLKITKLYEKQMHHKEINVHDREIQKNFKILLSNIKMSQIRGNTFIKGFKIDILSTVEALRKKGKLYKNIKAITPKELGIRNKITIHKATDINGYFWAIIAVEQKSRLLLKDVEKFEKIYAKLANHCNHNFKHKVIFIKAPLCSRAKESFKKHGWKVY